MFHIFTQYCILILLMFSLFSIFADVSGGWELLSIHRLPLFSYHLCMSQDTPEKLGNNGLLHILSLWIQPAALERKIKSGIADHALVVQSQGLMTSK